MIKINRKFFSNFSLILILAVLAIIILLPMVWAVMNSFKTTTEIFQGKLLPKNFNLKNFVTVWNRGNFKAYIFNSLVVSISVMFFRIVLSCLAGYSFAKLGFRKNKILLSLFLIGMVLPVHSLIISQFYLIRNLGLINTRIGLILLLVGGGLPFSVLMMRSFFISLPDTLVESAEIDGANIFIIFVRIMLPLAKPGILVVAVFGFIESWNEYLSSIVILISANMRTLSVGIVRFASDYVSDYGAIFASTVISFLFPIILFILLQRQFISGITFGAMKE